MNAPTNRTPVLPHEKLRAALSDLAAARALNARLCEALERLTRLYGILPEPTGVEHSAWSHARAALAAAKQVTP